MIKEFSLHIVLNDNHAEDEKATIRTKIVNTYPPVDGMEDVRILEQYAPMDEAGAIDRARKIFDTWIAKH